jgi:tetratricopeptide (TPR) repeat protein
MNPRNYAQEQCLLAAALLQQAESTREGEWFLDALDCYQAAMALDPDYLEPYLAMAWLWLSQGYAQQAHPFLLKAQSLEPFDTQLLALWQVFEESVKDIKQ